MIEDTHWADRSTRDLLSFLFSRPFESQVAIVASYRSDDLHRRHPLRKVAAEWARIPGVARMQLNPLPSDDVRALVHQLHPTPLTEAEIACIVERADGNAFFVEELVGATRLAQSLPDDLAELLLVRLDQLGDEAQAVVRTAAVAGRRVSHDLLAASSNVTLEALDVGLRDAIGHNVLVPARGESYAFRHALLAEAVYDDLLPGERARLHAAYASALAGNHGRGTAAELARHARAAHDLATAFDASIRAGDEAMSVGGPDEASGHYEAALELLADPPSRRRWRSTWRPSAPGPSTRSWSPATLPARCRWPRACSNGSRPTRLPPGGGSCWSRWSRRSSTRRAGSTRASTPPRHCG